VLAPGRFEWVLALDESLNSTAQVGGSNTMRTSIRMSRLGRRRWLTGGFATVVAAAAVALINVEPAAAVHDTGAFELDGNAVNGPAAGDDWDNVCHQVLGTDCSTSSNTSGETAVDWVSEPNLNASIFTGGGSKDPQDIN
jgi:hypothetical protein